MPIALFPGNVAHRFEALHRFRALLFAALTAGLVACGGGGSSDDASLANPASNETTSIQVGAGLLLVRSFGTTTSGDSRQHPQAEPPSPLPPGTVIRPVVAGVTRNAASYTFINPLNCAYIENGTITKLIEPTHGSVEFFHENVTYGGKCPGPYPSAVAKYTWTDPPSSPSKQDFFKLHFLTTSGRASLDSNLLAALISVRISRSGLDITDPHPPQEVWLGEKISLDVSIPGLPDGIVVVSQVWNIDDPYVGGYTQALSHSELLSAKVDKKTASFHWIAPSRAAGIQRKATYTAKLSDGSEVSASTSFKAFGPDITHVVPAIGELHVYNQYPIDIYSFGELLPSSRTSGPVRPGINIQHPAVTPASHPGTRIWTQLLEWSSKTVVMPGYADWDCNVPSTLDNFIIYPTPPQTSALSDTPISGMRHGSYQGHTRDFKARSFALWDPQLPGSIPVPLGYVDWGYTLVVDRDPGTGVISAGAFPIRPDAAFKVSSLYPLWDDRYVNGPPDPKFCFIHN